MIATVTCNTCGTPLDATRNGGRCARCLFAAAFDEPLEGGEIGTIGEHVLLEEIARGGMGVVYRARQREPERVVALKTMRGADLDSPAALERFRHEARAMADLEHAAILPVFTFGEHDGIPYFTMKLASGGTLAQRLGSYAGKWREIAALVATVADAVQHAHTHAVLHRDLKPGNILFDESGRAFVSDFGIAKLIGEKGADLTLTAAVLGTPHYLAPEIAARDARAATTASDVWSLGVILYELLAQRRPFEGESLPALLRAIVEMEPAPLRTVPRDLAVIAHKALAKEPARRYRTALALAEDLRRWLAGEAIHARPVSAFEKLRLWARRNPALAIATTIAASTMVFAGILLWRSNENLRAVLSGSLIEQARLARAQPQATTRETALRLLRDAAALTPNAGESRRAELRTEAVAALALPGIREVQRIAVYSELNSGSESFSGDLARYAAAHRDGGFAVYETATQKPVRIFTPPAGQEAEWRDFSANDYRLSPDGAMVAAAFLFPEKKESLSRVFDVATGTLLREVPGPDKAPNWPTWWNSSREGFAIGRGDGPPVLCDASGKEAGGFPAPSGYRFADSEMFSHPASRLVVVRTVEPTGIAVWRVGEGGAAPEQRWHLALPAWPSVVAWSPDGRQLAIADPKSHEILILDADTGKTTKHLPAGQAKILALVFPGDSILSLGHDERITWQSTSGPAFRLTTLAQARFLALSSDSRRIAYAPMKSTLGIAELVAPTSGKLWPGSGGHMRASCLGATPDGRTVVISTDAALEIWDTATGTLGERLAWPGGLKSDWPWFYVQPTGAAIVVSPGPHPAFFNPLWHFPLSAGRLGTPRQLTGTSPWDAVFGFSPDGKDWVVGGVSPTAKSAGEIDIAIWPDGDPARSRTVVRNTVASGLHICTPDSRYGITTTQRRADAHIWDLTTGKEVRTLGYPMPVTSIVSPDRRTLAIISPAESSLWDTATWTKRTTWPTPPGGDGFTAQFSPDGAYIAQLDRDGRVTIHAVADGAPLLTLALPPGFSPRECAWSSAEKIIVMDRVGAIYEWNLTTLAEAVRAVGLEW